MSAVSGPEIGDEPNRDERVKLKKKKKKENAATGASAAGIRAVSAQLVGFYFRAPMKAFFRTRVDYMAYARAIHPQAQAGQAWTWRISTPGLLIHAVRTQGWMFIPNHILPPMMANVSVGAVLYTSYLHALASLHDPSSGAAKRTYPPPEPKHTFTAGFVAGATQSFIAAPLDALQVRFRTNEMIEGQWKSMWHYGAHKLKEIGPRGVFAGWSMTLLKDSASCALFFSTFEYVKAQCYYRSLPLIYSGSYRQDQFDPTPIKPHYLIEPTFLLTAGVAATITQQAVQYPINQVQNIHYSRLEALDVAAKLEHNHRDLMRLYYKAYGETFAQIKAQARVSGGLIRWLYKGFAWTTLRQTPSTSAGLIVFEIVRRKYATERGGKLLDLGGKQFILQ